MNKERIPYATPGVLEEVDGKIQCGLCGDAFVSLGHHLRKFHGVDPARYRAWAGLNRGQALISTERASALRERQSAHLSAIRPDVTPVQADPVCMGKRSAGARREQMRTEHHRTGWPRPKKERPPKKQPEEWMESARVRLAELRNDPAWAAATAAKIRMARSRLTPEQIAEIRAAQGSVSKAELCRRYHITHTTVTKIWAGKKVE